MRITAFLITTVFTIILVDSVNHFLYFLKIDNFMNNCIYYGFCFFYGLFCAERFYRYILELLNKYRDYRGEKFIRGIGRNLIVKIGKKENKL